ncbi:MAG: SDR family NAD(P)-dependent oxidoreductase [Bacteroidota bacterium]|nr:SDR family NAD(P)-dependent oxidoreductase [Bacteroidota bacterium]MDP4211967.1 SDR family NAD(P)-dependent oxidoreductase [Bacteroidota bacterium]
MKKIICITGAGSGFGEACAIKFSEHHFDVIITGRRKEKLESLKKRIEEKQDVKVYVLPLDVRNKSAVFEAMESLPAKWKKIDVLLNNAGLALGRDNFDQASLDDWDTMIDTNVKGLLYMSRAVLPLMISRNRGHIINIGSIAATQVYQKGNVYCATKHAVEAISQSMRIDLLPHKIKVTAIHPGAAETEFSMVRLKHDEKEAKKTYEGYEPLQAADIADLVFFAASRPAHVCINELEVTCLAQANAFYLFKDPA